ncbi:hypothetical protein GYMLUDRAFT_57670 [Collybiopsis luxurians FD-317 M1]|uniref:Uncharacterized protein n=1 Tax=Collybiopsis luxurians FD-317 M1 TaxID=944289 RepID=A0A0D0BHP6_9AGAR|nr:hypothetical protein GYMLUDRAFT_57670 [Collybiopsis luxurians FD-317 M1]
MARRSQRIQEKNSVPNKPPVNATKLNSSRKRTRSKEDDISEAEVQQIPRKRAKKSSPKAASLEDDAPSEDDVAVAEKKRRVPEQYRKVRGKFALLERLVQDVPLEVILEVSTCT